MSLAKAVIVALCEANVAGRSHNEGLADAMIGVVLRRFQDAGRVETFGWTRYGGNIAFSLAGGDVIREAGFLASVRFSVPEDSLTPATAAVLEVLES